MIKRTKGLHIWQNTSRTVTDPDCEERWTRRSEQRVLCRAAVSRAFEVGRYVATGEKLESMMSVSGCDGQVDLTAKKKC